MNVRMRTNDWGYDVFTDKMSDSRFEKSFLIEYKALLAEGDNDVEYYAYDDPQNTSKVWAQEDANYFNEKILPDYTRASWNDRQAVAGEHKIGRGDLGLVFLENTRETAIPIEEAKAQPYVLYPRWSVTQDGKYYYRRDASDDFKANNVGLEKGMGVSACIKKHIDVNREGLNSEYGSRNVAMFRIAETYLLRAEAYGRKGNFAAAIADINAVRRRAAYKAGKTEPKYWLVCIPDQKSWNHRKTISIYSNRRQNVRYGNRCKVLGRFFPESKAENYPERQYRS